MLALAQERRRTWLNCILAPAGRVTGIVVIGIIPVIAVIAERAALRPPSKRMPASNPLIDEHSPKRTPVGTIRLAPVSAHAGSQSPD
jgi:hypothetical protein